jgi:hypothetical protein
MFFPDLGFVDRWALQKRGHIRLGFTLKTMLIIPNEDFHIVSIFNCHWVVMMRVNDEIVDPQMCFGFMTSNNVFNGEKSEERRSCGPVWEPFRQSSECTWQYFIGLNDLKVEKGESQECDWSPFALA